MSYLMLVSDIAPTPSFTGGIVLEQLVKTLQNCRIDMRILVDNDMSDYRISKDSNLGEVLWFIKPNEGWNKTSKYLIQFGEWFATKESKSISTVILRDISRNRPDHLVLVIQGQSSIRIANDLIKTGIPYTCIHWDPWTWWAKEHNVPANINQEISALYAQINSGGFHLVPTANFASHYKIEADRFLTLYPSIGNQITNPAEKSNTIKIAFVGQPYAKRQLDYFFSKLEDINWILDGKDIEVHTFGAGTNLYFPNLKDHGWVNYEALPEIITRFDFALLPYPDNERVPDAFNTSFPSKLVTYITANLPILYVGPAESSVDLFMKGIGIQLTYDYGAEELMSSFHNLIHNRAFYQSGGAGLFEKYFSKDSQKEIIRKWRVNNQIKDQFTVGRHEFVPKNIRSYHRVALDRKYFSIIIKKVFGIKLKLVFSFMRIRVAGKLKKIFKALLSI
jgi:hypothetical protein